MSSSLDPTDWTALRRDAHAMLDGMIDHMATLREQPVWSPMPPAAHAALQAPLPIEGASLREVHGAFVRDILPFGSGNAHPGFMGWVQGGGTPVGMLAEMLAGGLNANCGGRQHAAIEVERQVTRWTAELFGFPAEASGLFTSGASVANFMGLLVARVRALGPRARTAADAAGERPLTAYASTATHGCVARGMEMAGLGRDALRLVPVDGEHAIRLDLLEARIAADRAAGFRPFALVGTAGTVNCGAIDDLDGLARIAADEGLHFHVDGALGALGVLVPQIARRLKGIERADTLAFDWHKWGQAPYDAGFFLARDPQLHRATFEADAAYLSRADEGLAGGEFWPCDYGPELSRSFRALKVWFMLKTYGLAALGEVIAQTLALSRHLARRVAAEPELELLGPSSLNMVCFGLRCVDADRVNAAVVERLHLQGRVAPSLTMIDGRTAIRAAIVNHRTREEDVDALVDGVLALGRAVAPRVAA